MITEAFALLADLLVKSGATRLDLRPGAYEIVIDERWKAVINAHAEPVLWGSASIPPYHAALEYNGWPAGLMAANGGVIAAGECANEDTFIAAVKAAIAKRDASSTPEQQA